MADEIDEFADGLAIPSAPRPAFRLVPRFAQKFLHGKTITAAIGGLSSPSLEEKNGVDYASSAIRSGLVMIEHDRKLAADSLLAGVTYLGNVSAVALHWIPAIAQSARAGSDALVALAPGLLPHHGQTALKSAAIGANFASMATLEKSVATLMAVTKTVVEDQPVEAFRILAQSFSGKTRYGPHANCESDLIEPLAALLPPVAKAAAKVDPLATRTIIETIVGFPVGGPASPDYDLLAMREALGASGRRAKHNDGEIRVSLDVRRILYDIGNSLFTPAAHGLADLPHPGTPAAGIQP